jgi:predicted GIY-YIG superfamily endonuclease
MTTYDPPIETGLRGETYVSEHVETQGHTPTALQTPGVYALEVSVPADPAQAWADEFDADPDFLPDLDAAERVIYVGAASNIYDRLIDHVEGAVRQAALLRVCPPHSLFRVSLFDDADRAFERESGIALAMQQANPEWFVYQR